MDAAAVAIVGALIAAFGGYIVAARSLSGKITTSSASDLWTESRSMREWSAARVTELSERVRALEEKLDALGTEREKLVRQLDDSRDKLHEQDKTIEKLRWELDDVKRQQNGG